VLAVVAAYHQVVSHYLRAHACQEPFILATMRHISALHPVYKLMLPHFRYTLDINANARSILVNADGILEQVQLPAGYLFSIILATFPLLRAHDAILADIDSGWWACCRTEFSGEHCPTQVFTTGRYTMEIGAWAYKTSWFFKDMGFEADLIKS
jgi:hypothetical protein